MTTEFQREQEERRRIIREGSTFHQFQQSEAATSHGRFDAQEKSTVVGATDAPVYPRGPDWTVDPVGPEPPLGVSVNELQPCGEPHEIAASLERLGETGGLPGQPDGGEAQRSSIPPDAVSQTSPPTSTEVED